MEEVLEENVADANTYLPFKLVDNAVTKRIVEELDALPDAEEEGKIGSAFSFASVYSLSTSSLPTGRFTHESVVSYVHRLTMCGIWTDITLIDINRFINPSTASASTDTSSNVPSEPRIAILSVSPDMSTSYIPLMNSIFSAQKLVSYIQRLISDGTITQDVFDIESDNRRVQDLRTGHRFPTAGCTSDWRLLHLSGTEGCAATVSSREQYLY